MTSELAGTVPGMFYYVYRGNGYGPFVTYRELKASVFERCSQRFPHVNVYFGEVEVSEQRLVRASLQFVGDYDRRSNVFRFERVPLELRDPKNSKAWVTDRIHKVNTWRGGIDEL